MIIVMNESCVNLHPSLGGDMYVPLASPLGGSQPLNPVGINYVTNLST